MKNNNDDDDDDGDEEDGNNNNNNRHSHRHPHHHHHQQTPPPPPPPPQIPQQYGTTERVDSSGGGSSKTVSMSDLSSSTAFDYSTDDFSSDDGGAYFRQDPYYDYKNRQRRFFAPPPVPQPPSLLNDFVHSKNNAIIDNENDDDDDVEDSNNMRRSTQQQQQGPFKKKSTKHHHHDHRRLSSSSGGGGGAAVGSSLQSSSTMRELRRMNSRLSKIVQFQSNTEINSDLSNDDGNGHKHSRGKNENDDDDHDDGDFFNISETEPSPSSLSTNDDSHSRRGGGGGGGEMLGQQKQKKQRQHRSSVTSGGGTKSIRNFMAKMAYSIRSPSGIHDHRKQLSSEPAVQQQQQQIQPQLRQDSTGSGGSVSNSFPGDTTYSSSPASSSSYQLKPQPQQPQVQKDDATRGQEGVRSTSDSSNKDHGPSSLTDLSSSKKKNGGGGGGGGHFRKPSGGTTEYPYHSMMHHLTNVRDPIATATISPTNNSKSTMAPLNTSSLSSSNPKLLPTGRRRDSDGGSSYFDSPFSSSTSPLISPVSTGGRPVYDSNNNKNNNNKGAMTMMYGTTNNLATNNEDHNDDADYSSVFADDDDDDNDDEEDRSEVEALLLKFGNPAAAATVSTRPIEFVFTSRSMAATVAAYFLLDYESSRPPTLPADFATITPRQLALYRFHFSPMWRWFVNTAIVVLFLSHTQNRLVTAIMHTCVIVIFAIEVQIREILYGTNARQDRQHGDRRLVRPMVAFLFLLGLESWLWYLFDDKYQNTDESSPPLFSSMFKPLVFFYVSSKARDSLEALARISNIVGRVIAIELFLILTFAAIGCRMFGNRHESFHNLSTSWLSLFELSTTVNNPSLWMPMYQESSNQAIYFVVFIITCTIYYHSLVLSVVFQTYIQAMTEIHERSVSDREDAVRLAFLALIKEPHADYISTSSVKKCLQVVRPHYNSLKLKALVEIVDPANQRIVDYPSFRTKIRHALNASIRTARSATSLAMAVELIAVVVALLNFLYVIMVTSEWDAVWFENAHIVLASVITVLGLLELLIRFNPLHVQHFTPITRLNPFFDGLALFAALLSCVGIIQNAAGSKEEGHTDYLLMGRAIDMVRVMRFFPIFRDVVRRSSDVLPAMAGPLVLLLSVIHEFVFVGMAIWNGAIDVDGLMQNQILTPLYCLNNFNSYPEGLVTVFNLLIVNDWHAIAEVYLYAEWNSSPYVVYPFFASVICIGVFIMLNVITAFFVESFVTKRHDIFANTATTETGDEKPVVNHREFQIRTGENTNVRRSNVSARLSVDIPGATDDDDDDEIPVEGSSSYGLDQSTVTSTGSGEVFAFDIYEREGYDNIMATVAGLDDDEQEAFARSVCNYLEIFESLASGREKVGYMVCCQRSTQRFGNRRFQNNAAGFMTDDTLHQLVSYMHSEMLVLTIRKNTFEDRCLVRTFSHQTDPSLQLELTATLLRYQPAATLFVSRIRRVQK